MLKKSITYKNFDDETVTEEFYFNMTKAELVELELSEQSGLSDTLKAIIDAKDGSKIIEYFKKIILLAYGERSEDGRRFIKSPELAASFSHTEAYSQLFMELATDADAATAFISGIMPSDLAEEIAALPDTVTEIHTTPIPDTVDNKDISEMSAEELRALLIERNK